MLKQMVRTCIGTFLPAIAFAGPISFVFDYSTNTPGLGFLDPVEGAARQAALNQAGAMYSDLFGSYFKNSGVITLSVQYLNDASAPQAASASSAFENRPGTFGDGEVIRTKLLTNTDLNGAADDGGLIVNWAVDWQLNANGPYAANEYDFYAVLFHEFTHALGVGSEVWGDAAASDRFGQGVDGSSTPGSWSEFDKYLTDCQGSRVVDPNTFEVNQTVATTAKHTHGCFDGPNAVAVNGGDVPLNVNVDLSHLNDNEYPTAMMKPGVLPGPEVRKWLPVEVAILQDLGYNVVPEPGTSALVLAALALVSTARRRAGTGR